MIYVTDDKKGKPQSVTVVLCYEEALPNYFGNLELTAFGVNELEARANLTENLTRLINQLTQENVAIPVAGATQSSLPSML